MSVLPVFEDFFVFCFCFWPLLSVPDPDPAVWDLDLAVSERVPRQILLTEYVAGLGVGQCQPVGWPHVRPVGLPVCRTGAPQLSSIICFLVSPGQ